MTLLGFQSPANAQVGAGTITQTLTNINDNLNDISNELSNLQDQQQAQTQDQSLVVPVARLKSGGGKVLPKTGVDAAEVGGIGTASLVAGASLLEFARRRRKSWLTPVSASEAMATTRTVPPTPQLGRSEGDLLLPYVPTQAPEAPRESQGRDTITPSF